MSEHFTERMHRCFDGELEIEALSGPEIEQVRRLEEAITALALDATRLEDADVAERVMRQRVERLKTRPSNGFALQLRGHDGRRV